MYFSTLRLQQLERNARRGGLFNCEDFIHIKIAGGLPAMTLASLPQPAGLPGTEQDHNLQNVITVVLRGCWIFFAQGKRTAY